MFPVLSTFLCVWDVKVYTIGVAVIMHYPCWKKQSCNLGAIWYKLLTLSCHLHTILEWCSLPEPSVFVKYQSDLKAAYKETAW